MLLFCRDEKTTLHHPALNLTLVRKKELRHVELDDTSIIPSAYKDNDDLEYKVGVYAITNDCSISNRMDVDVIEALSFRDWNTAYAHVSSHVLLIGRD